MMKYLDGVFNFNATLIGFLLFLILINICPRIFQSQGGTSADAEDACISVRRPPLIDASLRVTGAKARHADVRVDRTRFNLALPFLLQLARTLLDAMPGEFL